MRLKRMAGLLLGLALVTTACGFSSTGEGEAETAEGAVATAVIATADSALGTVLVTGDGITLYGFTDDTSGVSTCYDDCASAWPPLTGELAVGAGLDASLFTSVARDDGTNQAVVGGFPLYTFIGDAGPGDLNGQGSGGVWFTVDVNGGLITGEQAPETDAAADQPAEAPAGAGEVNGETVLTDADGYSLYAFTNDAPGVSNCNAPCSDTWPPVDATETIAIDALQLTSIERQDGSTQLAVGGHAVYRYAGDEAPGQVNGQLVGGVWFAVSANGDLIIPDGVRTGSTDGGQTLIDHEGFTVYVFANDEIGVSNCGSPCSDTWPPVPGDSLIDGSQVAIAQFGTITREDGSLQLTLEGQPLYRYAGDEFPGDANGRTVGNGVWSTVAADTLGAGDPAETAPRAIADAPAAPPAGDSAGGGNGDDGYGSGDDGEAVAPAVPDNAVTVADTSVGLSIVNGDGLTLYGFLNDADGVSNCNDSCADAWPPVSGDTPIDTTQLDASLFKVIERADGSTQLAIGKWALYTFAGDGQPGDINGQGSGDVWFVAAPDGSLIR